MPKLALACCAALAFLGSAANATSITSTIGGNSSVSVAAGTIVTVDNVIHAGPTTVGGAGYAVEISFDYSGGSVVGGGGATNHPPGTFDLTGGTFTCNDLTGHCENIISCGDLTGFGATLPDGATFALVSIQIDTTGLAPGVYVVGAGLTGPADGIFNPGAVDLSSEYPSIAAVITIMPDPDGDGDGVPDDADNCLVEANPLQIDVDQDGYGNRCDPDFSQDGTVAVLDFNIMVAAFASADPLIDLDGDGVVSVIDVSILTELFAGPPGPSGLGCAGSVPCP